jgi:hypothetical protein
MQRCLEMHTLKPSAQRLWRQLSHELESISSICRIWGRCLSTEQREVRLGNKRTEQIGNRPEHRTKRSGETLSGLCSLYM